MSLAAAAMARLSKRRHVLRFVAIDSGIVLAKG
jgi:hypothetical protein